MFFTVIFWIFLKIFVGFADRIICLLYQKNPCRAYRRRNMEIEAFTSQLSSNRWGDSVSVMFFLIALISFSSATRGFSWDQKTFDTPLMAQPYCFIPPSEYVGSFSTSSDDADEFSLVTARKMSILQDSRIILSRGQQPTTPPTWDFSFPRCQSFNRSKPLCDDVTKFDSSETWSVGCVRRTKCELGKIRSDFRNFYCRENFANILVGYGVHAIISNTFIDQELIDWYQGHVRSTGTNEFSDAVRDIGSNWIIVPFAVVGTLYYCDRITDRVRFFDTRVGSGLCEFASRTARGYFVGIPTMLLSQLLIGAGRPNFPHPTSRWQPFRYDHGVSGHAFAGAMPFITLAQMSDNFWLKTGFYACSTFTAWSRFNDNKHYFSQSLLGWYLAYLSCRAVSKTEYKLLPRGLTVFPIVESRTTGIGFVYQW